LDNEINPWLEIPLEEYEAHMSMASVAQAQYLARVIDGRVQDIRPASVAIIGCSGGNGIEQLSPAFVQRVVAVDINPRFIEATRQRYNNRFNQFELLCQDFLSPGCSFEGVDLVFGGLIFEYVDYMSGLSAVKTFIKPGGYLSVVLQLPSETISAVSPSPYSSLSMLNGFLKLVPPEAFEIYAKTIGLSVIVSRRSELDSGKQFHELLFKKEP